MRRAAFLVLTGLTVPAHRNLVRQDLLPYADDAEGGWSDYSLKQAFMTALAIALAPRVGGQSESARRVVDFPASAWRDYRTFLLVADEPDVFAASFAPGPTKRAWTFGRLSEVLADPKLEGLKLREVAVVNLSAIAREIAERADAAGISLAADFAEAEPR